MNKKKYDVMIIGGGVAGITVAEQLAKFNIKTILLEKKPYLGGHTIRYCCKASESCNKCSVCVANDHYQKFLYSDPREIWLNAEVENLSSKDNHYQVMIRQKPLFISPQKCIGCGLCIEACPVSPDKAIEPVPPPGVANYYAVVENKCLYLKGKDCSECVKACPAFAIDFSIKENIQEVNVSAIVLATGFTPFPAQLKPNYGYGRFTNVISGIEAEEMILNCGRLLRKDNGSIPQKIAFIQCVGSRDVKLNHNYCSRVCCVYALKIASHLKRIHPDLDIHIFYMDIQTFGKGFTKFFNEQKKLFRFIRGLPGELTENPDKTISITYEDKTTDTFKKENYDLVILSVGMVANKDTKDLALKLGITLNEDGFFKSDYPINTSTTNLPGVFLAGACEGPKTISESIAHALQTASAIKNYLSSLLTTPSMEAK